MIEFKSFESLLGHLDTLANGWIYFDKTLDTLENARFMVSEGDEDIELEQIEVDDESIPRAIHELGMRPLLEVITVQDAVRLRRRVIPDATPQQFADAIRHYVREDSFLD